MGLFNLRGNPRIGINSNGKLTIDGVEQSISGGGSENITFRDILAGETFSINESTNPVTVYGNIILNKTAESLNKGATTTFTVTLDKAPTNNQTVNISSNNADITIDKSSLIFTPSNYGTAQTVTITVAGNTNITSGIITVSSPNVTSKTLTLTITSITTDPVAVTSVTLDKTSYSLNTGKTLQLNATITPSNATDKSLIWSSSDTNIATVSSSGLITAVADGNVSITVRTNDGGFTSQCNLTISTLSFDSKLNAYVQDSYMYVNPKTILDTDIITRTSEPNHIYFSFSTFLSNINKSLATATIDNASNAFNGLIPFVGEKSLSDFTSGLISCPDICYIINQGSIYIRIPTTVYTANSSKVQLALFSISERLPVLYGATNEVLTVTDDIINNITSLSTVSVVNNMYSSFANLKSGLNSDTSITGGINSISGRYTNAITDREVWYVNATTRLNFKIPQEKLAVCDLASIKQYLKDNRLTFWIAK